MSTQLRGTTQSLLNAILNGGPLTPGARVDFGLHDHAHVLALAEGVLNGKIAAEALDAALGCGQKIEKLVENAETHFIGLSFATSYDVIEGRYDLEKDCYVEPEAVIEAAEEERER